MKGASSHTFHFVLALIVLQAELLHAAPRTVIADEDRLLACDAFEGAAADPHLGRLD
jgi:hypothetical protein